MRQQRDASEPYVNMEILAHELDHLRYYQREWERHLAALEIIHQTYGYGSHHRHDYIGHASDLSHIRTMVYDRYDITIDQLPDAIREKEQLFLRERERRQRAGIPETEPEPQVPEHVPLRELFALAFGRRQQEEHLREEEEEEEE